MINYLSRHTSNIIFIYYSMPNLVLFLLLIFNSADPTSDSLKLELQKTDNPGTKASIYYSLARHYYGSNQDLAISYADSSIYFGELAELPKMQGNAINIKAVAYLIKSDFETSMKLNVDALRIRESIQDTLGLVESHLNIGNILYRTGESFEAAERYKKALTYAKMANSQRGLSLLYNNLGSYYRDKWISTGAKEDLDSAKAYLSESLEIKTSLNDVSGLIHTLNQLSELAQGEKQYMLAENYLKRSLKVSEGISNTELQISVLTQLSQFNLEVGDKYQALNYAKSAFELAEGMGSNYMISSTANYLIDAYQETGDYRNALEVAKQKIEADGLLFNESKQKIQDDLLIQYESEKKELENQRLLEEQRFLDLNLQRKNELLIAAVIILVGLIGLGIYQRKKNNELELAKKKIDMTLAQLTEKNDQVEKQSVLLSQANSELKEANSIREKLLSVVSHDVKAPLSSLQVLLEYWDQKILTNEELASLVPRIAKQTKTVQELLKNLLQWAQTQMKSSNLQLEEKNLRSLVDEAIQFAIPTAEGKKINILNAIPENLSIQTDSNRLNFIIRNLVSNSLKFTNPDGQIKVSFESTGNGNIHISDNGIGMSKEKLASLFQQGMGPSIGTAGEKGSGIGLLLCKEFAESMGARLEVESEENKGSTFTIVLG
jgi:two-component system, sensor histidine kinase and response regulator